jgi:hypothetical protein
MIKNVFDYFENLHTKDLPKNEHSIIMDNDRIIEIDNSGFASSYGRPNVSIDGTPYHAKKMHPRHPMMEFATGKMYNAIGIPAIPTYSLETIGNGAMKYKLMSQNLHSIQDLIFTIAGEVIKTKDISHYRVINDYKWAIFYDQELKDIFLKYMTPECFEMLGALYLIDELRTEVDRHEDNYFLVKGPNDRKYKGIIALDNELSELFLSDNAPSTKERFDRFASKPYYSYTPLCCSSLAVNYKTRITDIMKLIQDNVLTPKQIRILKSALKYDFPTEIRNAGKHPYLQTDALPAYDAASQLWEYNNSHIGRELGL